MSEHFWKLTSTKFAPRLRARAIWKSKSLKLEGFGGLFEVRVAKMGTTPARESDSEVKIVKNWRSRDVFGGGRRRDFDTLQNTWQAQEFVRVAKTLAGVGDLNWRGSETMRFAWQAQWFRALWCQCLKPPTLKPWKGCKFHVTEVLLCSDHFAWQLQDFVCLGSTFSWQAQYFWSIHLKIVKTYWNSEVKCPVNMSFLKEVLQKSFEFLIFNDSFFKEVSQNCFVFEL